MRLSKERISILARDLAKTLIARKHLAIDMQEGDVIARINQIITDEQMAEDRLDLEVRQMLKSHESEIRKGDADFQKMFILIKKKLAKERGIIL